ncbi:hypothetical protein ScPMuIL_006321 [Solemya velum]
MKAGFIGGLVIDLPKSTKAKKIFLCSFAGGASQQLPKGLGTETTIERKSQISFTEKRLTSDTKRKSETNKKF